MTDDRDDLEERLDQLEDTLEELRDEVVGDDRVELGKRKARPAAEKALRLTERVAVPVAVAALEANVKVLTFLQDRLRELEGEHETDEVDELRPSRVSERMLDRLDDALGRLDEAIADSDLPQNAEARELLERARELNADVRQRVGEPGGSTDEQEVVTIDVEEELDQLHEDVDDEE